MKKPNIKVYTFYSATIVFAVILFKAVTAYGEQYIKAPTNVDGKYNLEFTPAQQQKLPCPISGNLSLQLLQSGIYLNADITNPNHNQPKSSRHTPPISGSLKQGKIHLTGTKDQSDICPQANSINIPFQLTAQFQPESTLTGEIFLNNTSQSIKFVGKKQPESQILEESLGH